MPTLTETTSTELVVPIAPTIVHRVVERLSDNVWYVRGRNAQFSTAFAAMTAIREEVERDARHPIKVQIQWKGIPSTFIPPTTGSSL